MIKIVLIVKENCPACSIVKRVIAEAINKIDCEITFKVINNSNSNINCYNVKAFPTTIFYRDINEVKTDPPVYTEIARLEGSFPIDYLNRVINKIKLECNG